MIREVTMYQAVCDGCGKKNNWVWGTPEKALFAAIATDDWRIIGDKLYCPDCVEWDKETDSYKLKERSKQ